MEMIMIKLIRTLILTAITIFNMNAMAATQTLITVTNDEDTDLIKLYLVLDKNSDVEAFQMKTYTASGKKINDQTFDASEAETGIIIYKKEKRDIVKLISDNFAPHQGGDVELDFLYNGITGSRGDFGFDLKRDGDVWGVFVKGKKARSLHFVSNKKTFVGTVGVKEVIVTK
jgi:hypothetical protein